MFLGNIVQLSTNQLKSQHAYIINVTCGIMSVFDQENNVSWFCNDSALLVEYRYRRSWEEYFQQKIKHTLGTNPVVAYGIVLQCGHRPPLPDYHTESCSPTLQNEKENNMDKFKEKNNAQLWSKFIKRRKKELLKTCSIHAHNKLKYSLTGGFNHTNSLHCSATASCLWIAHKHQATWEYGLDLNYLYIAISINNLQGNQHLGAPQKCGGLKKSTPHQKSNPVTQQRNRVTSKTEVLAILASDKAPVSSRENLLRASLIWYSQIIFTGPVI